MLTAAREALIELGVLSPADPLPPFSARMSGNLVLLFYLEKARFYLVKVGVLSDLDREFRGLTMAHSAMPHNVPQPLQLGRHGPFQVLVSSGIYHDPLVPPLTAADERSLEKGIETFLASSARAFRTPLSGASCGKLREAIMQTSKDIEWPDWEAYWQRIRPRSEELAPVLQHGDFAINNIGIDRGELVFFDWEDFGLIDLPGFDLALLLLSLNNFNMRQLIEKLEGESMEARLVQRCSSYMGIGPAELIELYPAYLSLFVQTKSVLGYPQKVTGRVAAALSEWLRLTSAQASGRERAGPSSYGEPMKIGVARRSLAVALTETYLILVIQFVTSLILARLLTPSEIGVFSVAMVAVSIANTFREFGIISYLIKEQELTEEKIRAAAALSFTISWTLAVLIFAGSFWLTTFYREPRLLHVLWILAFNFLLIPFGSVVFALLRRDLRMVPILVVRVLSTVCSAGASIFLAWRGFGEISLALAMVVNSVVMVAAVQFIRPKGMPRWPSFRGARKLLAFSAQSLTSNLIGDAARAAPDVVLGKVQDMTAVGLFGRAMALVDLVAQFMLNSVWSVSLPYFSGVMREGGNVGASLVRTQTYITGVAWPFFTVLGLAAYPVILTLYGTQWLGSVSVARLLCLFGAITCTTTLANTAMVAADRMGLATRMTVKVSVVRILAVVAFAPFGLIPLAEAMIAAALIEFVLVLYATHHALSIRLLALLRGYARSAALAALCALPPVTILVFDAMEDLALAGLLWLALGSVVTWVVGSFMTRHPIFDELRRMVGRRP